MSIALVNIGSSHVGDLAGTAMAGDAVVCDGGQLIWIGSTSQVARSDHRLVVDVAGAGLVPGFIDTHVHVTFGDYTPRQQTIGFLESYLHGGMTTAVSASEVHVPGRPTDVVGVKALAIAAQRCFRQYRPGGVTVHAGSVILEPGLTAADFAELRAAGVWLAKAGFGAFADAMEYVPVVHAARQAGIVVMCHTGGGSIPGSLGRIDADALLAMDPDVCGHVNGGPTAMSDEDNRRIVLDGGAMALQLVQAGNLRSAIDIACLAGEHAQQHRLLIASDTPTGTGVIPLALLRSMAELVSLGAMDANVAMAAVTGNPADAYHLDGGRLTVGAPADLVVLDAPVCSMAVDWRAALAIGDLPAVAVVITDGEIRTARSRNTPPPAKPVAVHGGS